MPTKCCVINCSMRAERNGGTVKFYRFPMIPKRIPKLQPLAEERQQAWLNAIKRKDLNPVFLKYTHVCSKHFISGRSANLRDKLNPDWVPSLNLGYNTSSRSKRVPWMTKKRQNSIWSYELSAQLVHFWKQHPCLYDPDDMHYCEKVAQKEALSTIAKGLERFIQNIKPEEILKKINAFKQSYYNSVIHRRDLDKSYPNYNKLCFLNKYVQHRKDVGDFETINIPLSTNESLRDGCISLVDESDSAAIRTQFETVETANPPKDFTSEIVKKIKPESPQESAALNDMYDNLPSSNSSTITQSSEPTYPNDIEAFGEHLKAELNKILNNELRDEAIQRINEVILNKKAKQRALQLQSFSVEPVPQIKL